MSIYIHIALDILEQLLFEIVVGGIFFLTIFFLFYFLRLILQSLKYPNP